MSPQEQARIWPDMSSENRRVVWQQMNEDERGRLREALRPIQRGELRRRYECAARSPALRQEDYFRNYTLSPLEREHMRNQIIQSHMFGGHGLRKPGGRMHPVSGRR